MKNQFFFIFAHGIISITLTGFVRIIWRMTPTEILNERMWFPHILSISMNTFHSTWIECTEMNFHSSQFSSFITIMTSHTYTHTIKSIALKMELNLKEVKNTTCIRIKSIIQFHIENSEDFKHLLRHNFFFFFFSPFHILMILVCCFVVFYFVKLILKRQCQQFCRN